VWVGVDNVWEQENPEVRKMLLNRADSHTSGARGVGWLERKTHSLKKDTAVKLVGFLHTNQIFTIDKKRVSQNAEIKVFMDYPF
jgi:hypothetical protein